MNITSKRLVAVALAAGLGLAACGGDDNPSATDDSGSAATNGGAETGGDGGSMDYASLSGTLVGSGASSQKAAMEGWQAGFQAMAEGVTVEYDPVGSGGGRETFLSGGASFAGSDAPLSDEEYEKSKTRCAGDQGAIDLPHYISPIAIPYHLSDIEGQTLNLTAEAIAGIFANTITKWNDPAIADANPDLTLPDKAINPVHRSDDSGTTKNFTDYMSQAAGDVWTWGALETWDTEGPGGGEGAAQTSGVVQAVQAGDGSIGYADASQIGSLPAAAVGVGGDFVEYSPEAAAKIIDSSTRVTGRSEYDYSIEVNRTPESADTYPIALVSYHIVCLQYADAAEADLVKAFMTYVGSDQGQTDAADSAGSAPLSPDVAAEVAKSAAAISAG